MPETNSPETVATTEAATSKKREKLINVCDWVYSEEYGLFEKGKEFKNPGIPEEDVERAVCDHLLAVAT